jgi:hypothetical protein
VKRHSNILSPLGKRKKVRGIFTIHFGFLDEGMGTKVDNFRIGGLIEIR